MSFEYFFIKTDDNISVFYGNKFNYIKLRIFKKNIIMTNGYELYLNDSRSRSICRLHMDNQCHYYRKCTRIHISYECIVELKKMINTHNIFNNCCGFHDDIYTKYNDKIPKNIIIRETNIVVPREYIAKTSYFENRYQNNIVSLNNICRLHIQKKCFFYFDCKNIHVCKSFFDKNIKNILESYINNKIYFNKNKYEEKIKSLEKNDVDCNANGRNNDDNYYENNNNKNIQIEQNNSNKQLCKFDGTERKPNLFPEIIISDIDNQWTNYSLNETLQNKSLSLYNMNIYKFERYKKIFGIKYLYLCNMANDNINDMNNNKKNMSDIDVNDSFFFAKFNI